MTYLEKILQRKKIAVVLVAYNPEIEELILNLSSYVGQVSTVFLIDNSDNKNDLSKIQNIFSMLRVVTLGSNYGIAKAQNIGITLCLNEKFDFIILLDQDTFLQANYVGLMIRSYSENKKKINGLCALGPVAISSIDGHSYHRHTLNNGIKKVNQTLSSGLLVPARMFKEIGLMDEDLFIDFVDWDWCWRARALGHFVCVDTSIAISHLLGHKHITAFFLRFGVPSPIRHYYATRNTLLLLPKRYVPIIFKISGMVKIFLKMLLYPIMMDKPKLRFYYMLRGLKDGLNSKNGKLND